MRHGDNSPSALLPCCRVGRFIEQLLCEKPGGGHDKTVPTPAFISFYTILCPESQHSLPHVYFTVLQHLIRSSMIGPMRYFSAGMSFTGLYTACASRPGNRLSGLPGVRRASVASLEFTCCRRRHNPLAGCAVRKRRQIYVRLRRAQSRLSLCTSESFQEWSRMQAVGGRERWFPSPLRSQLSPLWQKDSQSTQGVPEIMSDWCRPCARFPYGYTERYRDWTSVLQRRSSFAPS